ncbi:hypothetical protein BKA82DRAFT_10412 [Pisolithus tinctorius]|uniref:Uncharacterized protein n=1 Tax=Pisolithus tinctorius Marx 270 TaxID=870435 RepID=A0A0C3JP62_PISTI|nr:hypothetical protein BKA82DRAFT_10412 [Pisolithus tinctorius]KIN99281.1 hypothetical protein M404DRAFT_10412 [Pisolithus tinctorius Marx 270]
MALLPLNQTPTQPISNPMGTDPSLIIITLADMSMIDPPPASENLVAFMPQITLPQLPEMTATNRLQAAAVMIQVTGQETDVLATHQRFVHLLCIVMTNVIARNIFKNPVIKSDFYPHFKPDGGSAPRCRAPHSTHKKNVNAVGLAWYREDIQEVLKYTCQALANKMILNVGWPHGQNTCTIWKSTMHVAMTKDIETLILKALGLIQSKAIEFGKTYMMEFFRTDDIWLLADPLVYTLWKTSLLEKLKDQTGITNFFMHKHDNNGLIIRWFRNSIFERFHTNFWYTQSVSPVKTFASSDKTMPTHHSLLWQLIHKQFTCSLDHVTMGRTHNSGSAIQFTGLDYCPVFDVYYEGFIEALQNTAIGPAFTACLMWLNTQGM